MPLGRFFAVLTGMALALASPVHAQTVEVSADRDRVEVDDLVTLELAIDGGRGRSVRAPTVTCCLQLVSPRPVFDATSTVNGETERTVAWHYRAIREGTARVLPARIEVGGQTLRTQAFDIEVIASSGLAAPSPAPANLPSGDLFVRAEPSRESAVVGQQILVDYVLYFDPSVQPRQTTPTGTWDAPGAWREELDVPPAYPRAVRRNGQTLEAVTIRRIALFPTRTGPLELAPMDFSIDLFRTNRAQSNDPFAPFFQPFSSSFDEEDVTAPSITLDVSPLPDGAPASFSGAVGQFGIATEVEPRRVTAGDPVRIALTLTGTGNLATLSAPELDTPPTVDVYDPKDELDLDLKADPLRGRKTFTYTLVPQSGGTLEVPPAVWSYYDPSDGQYKTLRSEAIEIPVDGDALASSTEAPEAATGLMTTADWRAAPGQTGWLWIVLGTGLALPALALAGLVAVRIGTNRTPVDTPERRRQRATPEVRRRLEDAQALDGPALFAALDTALRRFLADRLDVPPTTKSRPQIAHALAVRDVPESLRQRVDMLLADAERGQFAPRPCPRSPARAPRRPGDPRRAG
ncbi:MAG: BatD family protein, partial [Bacteroidota bacterium]